MTKILYIHGDDYAACDFEKLRDQNLLDPADLWAEGCGEYVTEDVFFEWDSLEFSEIDPKFVEFVQYELVDHDAAKSAMFYVV